jgi:hypothetical protein
LSWHCLRPFAGMIRIRFDGSTQFASSQPRSGLPGKRVRDEV